MENLLNRAFQLAYFIHRDRKVALRIVKGAMTKLEVAATTQGKRLYYRPTGRPSMSYDQKGGFRNKVAFSEAHLLQRLIYTESEPYEKEKEQEFPLAGLDEEDLVVRYVKHLVKSAIKRNSFYATLGVSRLLYNYSTTETMEIFYAVVQDPERVKDDYYYRSRKGVLMQELKERFGSLVKICRGQHGEERFQAHERPGQFIALVKESLNFFTPWGTLCPVPAGIDPIIEGFPELSNRGFREQDKVEVNRIHAVLHPDCYRRLVEALRFETPDRRLEVPQFYLSTDMNNGDGQNGQRLPSPAELNEQELVSIKKELDAQAERRQKHSSAHPLRVIVDGVERARLDLSRARSISFELDGEAELIEVRARDKAGDELLLASHLTTYDEVEKGARPIDVSIILEGGQKLSIVVRPDKSGSSAIIGVTYRETNLFKAVALYSRLLRARTLQNDSGEPVWHSRRRALTAIAVVLFIICLGLVAEYVRRTNQRPAQPAVANRSRTEPSTQAEERNPQTIAPNDDAIRNLNTEQNRRPQPTAKKSASPPPRSRVPRPDDKLDREPPSSTNTSAVREPLPNEPPGLTNDSLNTEAESTRGTQAALRAVSLNEVRKVYVDLRGNEATERDAREMLAENLRASGRLVLAQNLDEADALLKITFLSRAEAAAQKISVAAQLVNARGIVIWPAAHTASGGKYEGLAGDVARSIVRDLIADIQKSGQQLR